jgi:glyoxylase-like metal-dependent hydrolase (beta-lactamase superfamily II)
VIGALHRLRLGRLDVRIVKDGTESRPDLSQYVDSAPEELSDYAMSMLGGLMLVDSPERRILVDSGNGPERGPRSHAAEAAFEAEGIAPETIDAVLLTHGDPDHIMGLLTAAGDPVYPNATYFLHRELWDAWRAPPSAGLYFPGQASFVRQLAAVVADRCTPLSEERELLPGVRAVPALGHRAGHTAYLFESQGHKLLHIGDGAFDPVFLGRTDLLNTHDTDPERARTSRLALADRAIEEGALVAASHFQLPAIGTLTKAGEDRYTWTPIKDQEGD